MVYLTTLLAVLAFWKPSVTRPCDITRFYKPLPAPAGAIAVSPHGEVVDVQEILVPARQDPGTYAAVTVTRRANNLYRLPRMGLYAKTKLCQGRAVGQDATLVVQTLRGAKLGELIFPQ
jgi:hypothetical protein